MITFKPQLLYIDNSNIWSAGLIARIFKTPVVLRVMGVYEYMHDIYNKKKPTILEFFLIWLYKAPFKLVICTQDGSGVEGWLKKAIKPTVNRKVLLNGLPKNTSSEPIFPFIKKNIYITFLGKLEHAKGAEQFVNAMIIVLEKVKKNLIINIIGFGSLREKLISKVRKKNLNKKFRFIERLPHKNVFPILKNTDIYISLNRAGNISNANLEAIAACCCIIIPKSQKQNGIDLYTDKILPKVSVCRIKNADDIDGLVKETLNLVFNRKKIVKKKKSIAIVKKSFINWDDRVEKEINILKNLV